MIYDEPMLTYIRSQVVKISGQFPVNFEKYRFLDRLQVSADRTDGQERGTG